MTGRGGKGGSAFVGREAEFSELADGLDQAIEGHGQGFLVLGDPGIGKTRLASEVAGHAGSAGALALWGRCWEAGGAPPFWPWTEVLRAAAAADGDPEEPPLLSESKPGGSVRERADPARARFEVFDSVGSYLRRLAVRRPVLVVLDDLHAADLPSLLLLEFLLGGGLRQSRVAVIALSREQELRRSEHLKDAAGRVRRLCRTLRLSGLRRDEVAALIEQRVSTQPRADVVDAIHEATEGNPLFVEELSALVAQGVAVSESVVVPEGIRETIGLRSHHSRPRSSRCCRSAPSSAGSSTSDSWNK